MLQTLTSPKPCPVMLLPDVEKKSKVHYNQRERGFVMKIAIYPGSFDPVTKGHLDILKNASEIFDKVIIAVAHNGEKKGFLTVEERVMLIKESIKDFNNVEVDAFEGLTIEYAKKHGAEVLIRGLRAVSDFE